MHSPRILLIGPYDPHCGEYTFLAPPLGVWRLAGVLESAGAEVRVFDLESNNFRADAVQAAEDIQMPDSQMRAAARRQ